MRVLVYVEHAEGRLAGATPELLSLARELADAKSGEVDALVIASDPNPLMDALSGVDSVVVAKHDSFSAYAQPQHSAILAAVVQQRQPEIILFGYTANGLDLAPYLAATTGSLLASFCTRLEWQGEGLKADCQIYGGKLSASLQLSLPAIVSVTPGSYRERALPAKSATRIDIALPAGLETGPVRVLSQSAVDPSAVDITKAAKLVCVGRGIGEKGNIEQAASLATALGAEIGASRPIVDLGWLPKERQVGKSGRKVKPKLYLSLGVSGAPEHFEGMGASDLIIAINTDARAPIFGFAHYGATVDCLDLASALERALAGRGA